MPNSTNESTGKSYEYVRVWASAVAFVVLFLFNLLINWTIVREERLRKHARFVLVFHLLLSATVYFAVCFVFYLQIQMQVKIARLTCTALITVLTTSASNILLTITTMALDRYFAICFPLKYDNVRFKQWPWLLGIVTWALASIIPLTIFPKYSEPVTQDIEDCGRKRLRGTEVHKILLISICTVLILYSYVRILCEGRRLGVLNRRNRAGCRTIALHGLQLAVYILPNFINFVLYVLMRNDLIKPTMKDQFSVINFVFFSLAQCIAPIVYGLRKEELLQLLCQRFPCLTCHLKSFLESVVQATCPHSQPRHRERRMTSETLLSSQTSQTTV